MSDTTANRLEELLKELHLPAMRASYQEVTRTAIAESLSYEAYLCELLTCECEVRRRNRIERLLRESRLPLEKTLESFDLSRFPRRLQQQVAALLDGGFLGRKENVLAFGNPGSGKTHLLCGLCQEMVHKGYRVLYTTTSLLVQELLAAKRDLVLPNKLRRLGVYDALLIDDLGYVQQNREEMEVLFTLLAERYERGSVLITSNLPFSKWESIFKDPMTTAAAIDRLVHHSVILELNLPSYRMEAARKNGQKPKDTSEAGSAVEGET
jgi:DNA replication protein DnaC